MNLKVLLTSLKQFIKLPGNLLVQTKSNQFLILSTLLHIFRLVFFSIFRLLLHLSIALELHTAATPATRLLPVLSKWCSCSPDFQKPLSKWLALEPCTGSD